MICIEKRRKHLKKGERKMSKTLCFLTLALACSLGFLGAENSSKEEEKFPFIAEVFDTRPDYKVSVNLRGGDGINYKILRTVREDDELIVLGRRGDWYKVKVKKDMVLPVWVKKDLIEIKEDAAFCLGDKVTLRAAASTKSSPLGYLDRHANLKVLSVKNSWAKIRAPEDTAVWIHSRYLRYKAPFTEKTENPLENFQKVEKEKAQIQEVKTAASDVEMRGEISEIQQEVQQEQEKQLNKESQNKHNDDLVRIRKIFEEKIAELRTHRIKELTVSDHIGSMDQYTASGKMLEIDTENTLITHQLQLGLRTTYLLKAALDQEGNPLVNLADYNDHYVGVDGIIEEDASGRRVIAVKKLVILDSKK
jgi:uncharacterized protein YgiM (DUF1202 family)